MMTSDFFAFLFDYLTKKNSRQIDVVVIRGGCGNSDIVVLCSALR